MTFRHKAVYGQTGQGKTWFLKRCAKQLRNYKQKVLVWSGVGDIDFPAGCKCTLEVDELEDWLGRPENFRSFVMLDEGAILYEEAAKRTNYPNIHRLFQAGRHKGYTAYIATQWPTSIPPKVRLNCGETFCFRLGGEEYAQQVWKDNNRLNFEGKPAWQVILDLQKLDCLHFQQPEFIEKLSL